LVFGLGFRIWKDTKIRAWVWPGELFVTLMSVEGLGFMLGELFAPLNVTKNL